ncbi:hypothetical protein [Streptomyces sp. NBC_00063]|uniref:phage integrase central domain-containing protein n=1 Tax=Streptomyces sp. NBC_00063 TaxID=2975638 RepID=UPI00225270B8|nr:hypothetical protein [Streptomyces sp. NBC_00063]MCX5440904.1 site-specific integrase [Streptomyces sp. NBC_00063]
MHNSSAPPLTATVLPARTPFEARETLLTDWVHRWWLTTDVGPNTASHYRSLLKNHILPRWGSLPLHLIAPSDVTVWLKSLQQRYARSTTTSIGKLLALVMAAAVTERLIPDNPVRIPRQRGRERRGEDQLWATEHEVISLARRIAHLADPTQGLLVITAAYTGMRWGELASLRRPSSPAPRANSCARTPLHQHQGQTPAPLHLRPPNLGTCLPRHHPD